MLLARCLTLLCCLLLVDSIQAQTRKEKVFNDRVQITQQGFWIYNDLEEGFSAAKRSGVPLLVTFRCIPCEECVKLDEELIEQDAALQELLGEFVRVRVITTNGLDLEQFQFDFDQSFAMTMLNADGTIYGRYGTRSDRIAWEADVSLAGLAKALEKTLELHAAYPSNRTQLAGKQPREPLFETPNDAPLHQGKFPRKLEFNDNVVKNCIHCHMVGDAEREFYWARQQPIPDEVLFPYPHPKAVGWIVDPRTTGTLREVLPESPAAASGFRAGDEIIRVEEQPILSQADLQWVLHHAADTDQLAVEIRRAGEERRLELELPSGWRRRDNIEWRVTSWPMRRMVTGGLKLKSLEQDRREELGLAADEMALVVEHVGQYGAHAAAKRAGFQKGDILVRFDGRSDLLRETDVLAYGVQRKHAGQEVSVDVWRDGRRLTLQLPIQR